MKSTREQMDIISAYEELGSYRAVAQLCGSSDKTVKAILERRELGIFGRERQPRQVRKNTAAAMDVIHQKVRDTDGRISAKRLLPAARAAGYTGSARNFRRAVSSVKRLWRQRRRVYRPWVPTIGQHLVIDWGTEGNVQMFCAVLAWSRFRFVRFATNQRQETTLRFLAECFELLGGVPAVVLSDRMGCLKAGVVANVVVPHPEYVRFAAHYGFRPDFCEGGDPETKGMVEALVRYGKNDLVVPAGGWAGPDHANGAAAIWCDEVNVALHSEIQAVPAERLVAEKELLRPLPSLRPAMTTGEPRKVSKLSLVRFGSARYSVPNRLLGVGVRVSAQDSQVIVTHDGEEVARHDLVAPGEVAIIDEHYGGAAKRPSRSMRPRTATEKAFVGLGAIAERFLREAAAAGTPSLAGVLGEVLHLEGAFGREPTLRALERAVTYHRYGGADVRSILEAGSGVAEPTGAGQPLTVALPPVPTRSLSAYALEEMR